MRGKTFPILMAALLFVAAIGCSSEKNKPDETAKKDKAKNKNPDKIKDDKPTDVKPVTNGGDKPKASAAAENPIDLSYITDDFFAAVVIHPRRLSESPVLKGLPQDELMKELMSDLRFEIPIDLRKIEQVIVLVDPAGITSIPFAFGGRKEEKFENEIKKPGNFDKDDSFDKDEADRDDEPFERKDPRKDFGDKKGDFDPRDDQFGPPRGGPPFQFPTVIIRFGDPKDRETVLAESGFHESTEKTSHQGKDYYKMKEAPAAVFLPDDRTIVVAMEPLLKKMITAKEAKSALIDRLRSIDAENDLIVAVDLGSIRKQIDELKEGAPKEGAPEEMAQAFATADQIKGVSLAFNLRGKTLLSLQVEGADEEAAKLLDALAQGLLKKGKDRYPQMRDEFVQDEYTISPSLREQIKPLIAIADSLVAGVELKKTGATLTLTAKAPEGFETLGSTIGQIIEKQRAEAKRLRPSNNLKQIGLAFLNFHDSYKTFPPAAGDANPSLENSKKPPSSWRVRILLFMEGANIFDRYKFDEPWDSADNKELLEDFKPQWLELDEKGRTPYVVFTGPGTVFEGKKGLSLAAISDGTSNTLLVIEAPRSKAVTWYQPVDLVFDPKDPTAALGEIPEEGLWAVFCDGHVSKLSKEFLEENLKAIVTRAGGEKVELP